MLRSITLQLEPTISTTKGTSASNTYNNLTTAQALGILGEALNTTISTGDTTYNASSAVFTYNSSSWLIVDDGTDDAASEMRTLCSSLSGSQVLTRLVMLRLFK